ncbi:Ectoine hydroxylase-related dioxygenase, phytanoyl-CoA dioxygenase (PhyH) family [Tistlia consotensis]|uniref:Ectoine hydroxylase-related dioxygenase, phytanoyl-CoA dioxygenase (PhyH) family n=1 Tax=Tistlia consotensis USBA 355 TaxID=560819 RepID=A0A1Y6B940_9PROT|nr:phytanoyl-CoA dioxygenase family protein [Tistlia consotensis]SME91092.1 Ectoine hydroxylase-related dioxygenase, phytanoyl-CoA dioxygenase (PhyH) family [Tistlia consotensis USBA 355]SNR27107.1 Ectoine hydroxylase-related dioxygenase, phytanoyl-CoA dioxygenase (PhyH) family [Tistlia consotensis]
MSAVDTSPRIDLEEAMRKLEQDGYAVLENVLRPEELKLYSDTVDRLMAEERAHPPVPRDGLADPEQDALIRDYYLGHYTVSEAEADRLVARARHERARNRNTPWPVPYGKVSKNFIHLPTLFDQDQSQRVWQIISKAPEMAPVVENPAVLGLVRHMLGEDCNLHDYQATSIGPHTGGGAWHVDAPLGQIPEPLPEFPLMIQTVWLLDDFTADNGATRVMPGSHRYRKSPTWLHGSLEGEVVLTAPAGSVALWLSNTWHRSGPNDTDGPRRALICNYNRSWLRGFTDFVATLDPAVADSFSPTVRYLLGYGARAPECR